VAADILDMAVGKYKINALAGQQRIGIASIAFDLRKPTGLFSGVKIDNG
jgi:hypothetical protein